MDYKQEYRKFIRYNKKYREVVAERKGFCSAEAYILFLNREKMKLEEQESKITFMHKVNNLFRKIWR